MFYQEVEDINTYTKDEFGRNFVKLESLLPSTLLLHEILHLLLKNI